MTSDNKNDINDKSTKTSAPAIDASSGGAAMSGAASTETGGRGKPPRKAQAASAAEAVKRRGGYGTPPVDTQFKPGESGNPSGGRKKPKLPHHIGNQIDGVTIAMIGELNHIMMYGIPKKRPKGAYSGAKAFAQVLYRDAMMKEGYARKRLYALYHEEPRTRLDVFKPHGREELEASAMAKMVRAIIDPYVDDAGLERLLREIADDKRELGDPD